MSDKPNEVDMDYLIREHMRTMHAVLDCVQLVSIPSQYPLVRSKVLRLMNNFKRLLEGPDGS